MKLIKRALLFSIILSPAFGHCADKVKKQPVAVPAPKVPIPAFQPPDNETTRAFREDLKKAEGGNPEAQCEIASIFATGNSSLGIKLDRNIARSWYLKAANQGYGPAFRRLSMLHANEAYMCKTRGESESEEVAEHIKWELIARNKDEYPNRRWTFGNMSESTKAEGERRAKAFRDEQAKKPPAHSGK